MLSDEYSAKICGLQSVEVLKSMINLPVDYIGFVFAKSRRKVSPRKAAQLMQVLREWDHNKIPAAVGVLVNPDLNELVELRSDARRRACMVRNRRNFAGK